MKITYINKERNKCEFIHTSSLTILRTRMNPVNNLKKIIIVSIIILLAFSKNVLAFKDDLTLLINLRGNWSFTIGINDEWISPQFDDSNWETIRVPSSWEDQGFNGYNGYGFYRKKFQISSSYKGRMLYLYLGYIDDVDEVYFNGRKIGSKGSFPPNYITAYNAERIYFIPEQYINFDAANLITVKVYDSQQEGGIVSGDVGIYGGKNAIKFDANLQSLWKFKTGDDLKRKDVNYDDSQWDNVLVPSKWEDQGYRDYDGYGWYRKWIIFNGNENERYVIVLGKIDDVDQVYINGVLIGSTGNLTSQVYKRVDTNGEYNALRGYYIPADMLKKGQKYIIAVRVLDTGGEGGIYEGPVGIITQTKYIEYWRKIREEKD